MMVLLTIFWDSEGVVHTIFGTRQHREFYEICEHTGETESEVATGKE